MSKTKKEELEKTILSEEKETQKIAERYHVPYIDLSSYTLSRDLVQSFPVEFLCRSNFIPIEQNEDFMKSQPSSNLSALLYC